MSLSYSSADLIKMGFIEMEHSLFPERWNITLEMFGSQISIPSGRPWTSDIDIDY